MRTIILFWNPSISNYKKKNYDHFAEMNNHPEAHLDDDEILEFNWAVWENDKADYGDRCFMMKVGDETPGIVFEGNLASFPYHNDDWAGRGRNVCYCDIDLGFMCQSDKPLLTQDQLEEAIPGFCWSGGHSGRYLTDEEGEKLELMWQEALYKANPNECFHGISELGSEAAEVICKQLDGKKCAACGYDNEAMNGDDHKPFLFWSSKEERMAEDDSILKHIYFLCHNCEDQNEGYLRKLLGLPLPFADERFDHFFWSEKLQLFLRVDEHHNHFTKKDGEEEQGPIAMPRNENYQPDAYIRKGEFREISREKYYK